MTKSQTKVPVLIVGGGPAGLTASILLRQLGVESLVLERRPSTSNLPKAHILNQPTMEILAGCGIAEEVYEQGSPIEFMSRVSWYTSLAGPTEFHGREIAHRDSWGGGADEPAYARASRFRSTNLPQMRLEPLLRRRAEQLSPGQVRFGHDVVALEQSDTGVVATVEDRDDGTCYSVHADYAIGADGGRTVGASIGAVLEGQRDLVKMISTHITVDLRELNPDPAVSIFWFVNPDTFGSIGSGVLIKMGGSAWGSRSDEWVFGFATTPDDPQVFDSAYVIERVRRAVGVPDLAVAAHRVCPWRVESVVADRFSTGRVFLAGDAAHRHPPTGALGLNSAVQDVFNLTWKLAAVINDEADASLLDSYETERRPVALRNTAQSLASFFQHAEIDQAIGMGPETPPEEGWAALAELFSGTPAGEAKRSAVDGAAERKKLEFSAHNIEIGYRYDSGALVPERPPAGEQDPCTFIPSARPGSRMPHAWVGSGVHRQSTHDLVRPGRFTLFIGHDGASWQDAAEQVQAARDLPLDLVMIGDAPGLEDATGAWREQSETGPAGAVLIRPDRHVAWRSTGAVAEPLTTLREVFDAVLPIGSAVATGALA